MSNNDFLWKSKSIERLGTDISNLDLKYTLFRSWKLFFFRKLKGEFKIIEEKLSRYKKYLMFREGFDSPTYSKPFFRNGKHQLKVRVNNERWMNCGGSEVKIGVVTDEFDEKEMLEVGELNDSAFIISCDGRYLSGFGQKCKRHQYKRMFSNSAKEIGDIVTVDLDLDLKTLYFSLNEVKCGVGMVNLPEKNFSFVVQSSNPNLSLLRMSTNLQDQ